MEDSQTILVDFEMTYDDLMKGNRELIFRKKILIVFSVFIASLIISLALLYAFGVLHYNATDVAIFGFLLLVLILPYLRFLTLKNYWKTAQHVKNVQWRIDESGIEITSEVGNISLNWLQVYNIVETKNFYAVSYTSMNSSLLPKRVLKEKEIIRFNILIKANFNPSLTKFRK